MNLSVCLSVCFNMILTEEKSKVDRCVYRSPDLIYIASANVGTPYCSPRQMAPLTVSRRNIPARRCFPSRWMLPRGTQCSARRRDSDYAP